MTTSLRALGKSREDQRSDTAAKIKTGCRVDNFKTGQPPARRGLTIHLASTIIWLILSMVFALPLMLLRQPDISGAELVIWVLPFALLVILICLIWLKILHTKS